MLVPRTPAQCLTRFKKRRCLLAKRYSWQTTLPRKTQKNGFLIAKGWSNGLQEFFNRNFDFTSISVFACFDGCPDHIYRSYFHSVRCRLIKVLFPIHVDLSSLATCPISHGPVFYGIFSPRGYLLWVMSLKMETWPDWTKLFQWTHGAVARPILPEIQVMSCKALKGTKLLIRCVFDFFDRFCTSLNSSCFVDIIRILGLSFLWKDRDKVQIPRAGAWSMPCLLRHDCRTAFCWWLFSCTDMTFGIIREMVGYELWLDDPLHLVRRHSELSSRPT